MSSAEKKSYFGRTQHDKKVFKSQKESTLVIKDIKIRSRDQRVIPNLKGQLFSSDMGCGR